MNKNKKLLLKSNLPIKNKFKNRQTNECDEQRNLAAKLSKSNADYIMIPNFGDEKTNWLLLYDPNPRWEITPRALRIMNQYETCICSMRQLWNKGCNCGGK